MHELAPRGMDIDGHAVPIDEQGFAELLERFEGVLELDTVPNQIDLGSASRTRHTVRISVARLSSRRPHGVALCNEIVREWVSSCGYGSRACTRACSELQRHSRTDPGFASMAIRTYMRGAGSSLSSSGARGPRSS